MRIPAFTRSLLLLLAAASPALLFAQFQKPSDEELKMTEDPKAPGAAAVYLYIEETADDMLHMHSYYARIKVLTEKGKELATVHIPYERNSFRVENIEGRTIHADGSIVPLTAKPEDLLAVKGKDYQINTMVFTLPSVEVGSILEYRLQIRYDDNMASSPSWQIQQPYFVHNAHYKFIPAKLDYGHYLVDGRGHTLDKLMWATTSMPISTVVYAPANNRYSVDVADIPATPSEESMPPLNAVNQRVEFYYTYASSGKEFWETEEKWWAKNTERFTNPKGPLKQAVAEIVAPTDTEEQKARKIYAAAMKLDNTDFSRKKSEAERKAEKLKAIKDAEDVWKNQSGTGDEIALLYVALARAAGLTVWPMEVVDRSRAIFDVSYLNARQLDDYIAVAEIGGKDVYLDPGQKMCTYGFLHWKHTLATGFQLTEKGATIATTPPNTYQDAAVKRVADLQLDASGAVRGGVRVVMNGPDALYWRQLALENDTEEVKKRFAEEFRGVVPDGVQVEFDHFTGLDDPNINLVAFLNVSGSLGTATGKRLILPGMFFASRGAHPFVELDKRSAPIDVHYGQINEDDVTYRLPAGFTIESTPQAADVSWPAHALLKIRSTAKDGSVEVTRVLAHSYVLLLPQKYSDLHGFYQKVAAADQQQIVLTRDAGTKGN